MARAATTADVFNAIAEAKRREIMDVLARVGECAVGELVGLMRLPQPTVSKHLGVLRKVGLVGVRKRGRERVYRLQAEELQAVHYWVRTFEAHWAHQLDRVKLRAERLAHDEQSSGAELST